MKKVFYLFLSVSLIFTSCKKEEGCTDSNALNYNVDAEEDDGSCSFAIYGGSWTTQSIEQNGSMSISMMGIPLLDSTINYIETNADSLDPYKLVFEDNYTYTEYDQSNNIIEDGTWSLSDNQLTVNTPDTNLVLTVNNLGKSNLSMSISIVENGTEDGMTFDVDINQTIIATRVW